MDLEGVASLADVYPLENGNVNDVERSDLHHASKKCCAAPPFDSMSDPRKDDRN